MALAILQSSHPVPVFASRFGFTRGTLPDTGPAIAEQRRTNSQVCRAGLDRGLKIPAHTGRDHRGGGPHRAHGRGAVEQPCERRGGRHAERSDGHHSAQYQPGFGLQRLGQGRNLCGRRPATSRVTVQADLDETVDDPLGPARGPAERVDQPSPAWSCAA